MSELNCSSQDLASDDKRLIRKFATAFRQLRIKEVVIPKEDLTIILRLLPNILRDPLRYDFEIHTYLQEKNGDELETGYVFIGPQEKLTDDCFSGDSFSPTLVNGLHNRFGRYLDG